MNSSDFVKDGWQAGLWRITTCTATFTGGTAGSVSNGVITVGTNNTAITVSNCFSNDYNNYRIIYSNGVGSSINEENRLSLNAINTGYYSAGYLISYNGGQAVRNQANTAFWRAGQTDIIGTFMDVELFNPFISGVYTAYKCQEIGFSTTRSATPLGGWVNSTASITSFTITRGSGNYSGGQIRVYGYNN
jgi:hypothetical protein